jgi:hypothetical protein
MPAAVLEAAGRILVGLTGGLDDPVQGHPLIRDQLAHLGSFWSLDRSDWVQTGGVCP